jgi:hypothetical protein
MTDYSLPLVVLRRLTNEYETAMLKRQFDKAYQIGSDMVEMTLKLQDLANDKNSIING